MSKTITVQVPSGWGDDKPSVFFDLARDNAFGSFVHLPGHYSKLVAVDSAFLLISENLLNPEDVSAPFFLMKSHSSFRAAAWMAMTGQSPEAFMVMRGCIESALYGLYLNRNEDSFKTYMNRHDDDAARKAVRAEFTIGRMWKCLKSVDGKLQVDVENVYEKTIDFGAHPNVAALVAATSMLKGNERVQFKLAYLTAERDVIGGTMKSAAQAGVVALSIFRHVFKERYDLLGLTDKLPGLRESL